MPTLATMSMMFIMSTMDMSIMSTKTTYHTEEAP